MVFPSGFALAQKVNLIIQDYGQLTAYFILALRSPIITAQLQYKRWRFECGE